MAIIITNGYKYIMYQDNQTKKTYSIAEAYQFADVEEAIKGLEHAPAKTKHYYIYDTDSEQIVWRWFPSNWKKCIQTCNGSMNNSEYQRCKHKYFTRFKRIQIYNKTKGCCYLCGSHIPFELFEIEHKIPLARGGTNDMNNLYPSCHDCNLMKGSIDSKDLLVKMKQIQLYQIKNKYGEKSFRYKLASIILNSID